MLTVRFVISKRICDADWVEIRSLTLNHDLCRPITFFFIRDYLLFYPVPLNKSANKTMRYNRVVHYIVIGDDVSVDYYNLLINNKNMAY